PNPGADAPRKSFPEKVGAKLLIIILIYKHLQKNPCNLTLFNITAGTPCSVKRWLCNAVSFIFASLCSSNIEGLSFMPFRNKRNSRDDKSGRPHRPGSNRRRSQGEENPYRKEGPSGDNDRPFNKSKSFGKDRPFNNEKPYRQERPFGKD